MALNLRRCRNDQPVHKGEACFSVRAKPESGSKVLAYVPEIWLEDVSFFVRASPLRRIQETGTRGVCCFVVGTVISKRSPKVLERKGWSAVRVDVFDEGCFYRASTGACVRTAKFARIRERSIQAFGLSDGDAVSSLRELSAPGRNPPLRVYGPRRRSFRGDLGGVNYELAPARETAAAVHWVLDQHPHCVIVEGSDDWNAPLYARPHQLAARYRIEPEALWHTGTSGKTASGCVFSDASFARFCHAYAVEWGFPPECCPGPPPALERPECGCWSGEGLRIYRR